MTIIKKVHDLHMRFLGLFPKKQLYKEILTKLNEENIFMRGKYFTINRINSCLDKYEKLYN